MSVKKPKLGSGGSRLKSRGLSLVQAAFDQNGKALVRRAAGAEGVPMSVFVVSAALERAEKVLGKSK